MAELSQEEAQELFNNGGTLVFLDVPEGTEFGIDYNSWTVGPRFKGVKMIPPGVHFIYYSSVNQDKQAAPRMGFFHNFQQGEVLIKKWNKQDEDISILAVDPAEQEQVEANKQDMDRFLGAYPYENYEKWVSLTDQMTFDLIQKIQPASGKISSAAQFESELSTSQSRREAELSNTARSVDKDGLPNMKITPGTDFNFTQVPKKKYPEGSTATEITDYSRDYSYVFNKIINERFDSSGLCLLGEIQFAFVCFLLGQCFEAFEQWKVLVNLFCFTEKAIDKQEDLFNKLIAVLHFQIKEIPEDFFVDIVTNNNFLVHNLRSFFCNVLDSKSDSLKAKAKRFKSHLEKKFGWDLNTEEDDDDPVVVELDLD